MGPDEKGGGTWFCDVCGEPVPAAGGYVTWTRWDIEGFEVRLIHKSRCDRDPERFLSSLPLPDLIGPDGRAKLLSFISYGPVHERLGSEEIERPVGKRWPINAWAELARRLLLPNYEAVHRAYAAGEYELDGANEVYPYTQEGIHNFLTRDND